MGCRSYKKIKRNGGNKQYIVRSNRIIHALCKTLYLLHSGSYQLLRHGNTQHGSYCEMPIACCLVSYTFSSVLICSHQWELHLLLFGFCEAWLISRAGVSQLVAGCCNNVVNGLYQVILIRMYRMEVMKKIGRKSKEKRKFFCFWASNILVFQTPPNSLESSNSHLFLPPPPCSFPFYFFIDLTQLFIHKAFQRRKQGNSLPASGLFIFHLTWPTIAFCISAPFFPL